MTRLIERQQIFRFLLPFYTCYFVTFLVPPPQIKLSCADRILGMLCFLSIWVITTGSAYLAKKRLSSIHGNISLVNKIIFSLPFEVHLPGHNFTGPGTKLDERMDANLNWLKESKPVNRVDHASYEHDVGYMLADTSMQRAQLDEELIDAMDDILDVSVVSTREKIEARIVKICMTLKSLLRSL